METRTKVIAAIDRYLETPTIAEAIKSVGLSSREFFKYLTLDQELMKSYLFAQRSKADILVDQAIAISDTEQNAFKARNQIDIRKWVASKYNSIKFGDRLDVTIEHLDLRGALEEARNRSRTVTQLVESTNKTLHAASDSPSGVAELGALEGFLS